MDTCYACGAGVSERAVYCRQCGAKVCYGSLNAAENAQEQREFDEYLDGTVQRLTKSKCRTVQAFLEKKYYEKRMWTYYWAAVAASVVLMIISFGWQSIFGSILCGLLVGWLVTVFISCILRLRSTKRGSVSRSEPIDTSDLIEFLNCRLGKWYPYFYDWHFMDKESSDIDVDLGNEIASSVASGVLTWLLNNRPDHSVYIGAEYGPKARCYVIVEFEENAEESSAPFKFSVSSRKGVGLMDEMSYAAGFAGYDCDMTGVPLVYAAVEYYIRKTGNER